MKGRQALVVGAGSGIGASVARLLRREDASVWIADLDEKSATELATELGPKASALQVDVTDEASVASALEVVSAGGAGLDILVNAAGVSGAMQPISELPVASWDRTLSVNLRGTFLTTRAALPLLSQSDAGAIVNVASGAGVRGVPMLADYSASKHGVIGLTKSVALEYARSGVRANVVCPGSIRTPMLRDFSGSEDSMEQMGRYAPMKRLGEPEEVAEAIIWLCSGAAAFVTGSVVEVDGGVAAS